MAAAMAAVDSLTIADLRYNQLDAESATMLAAIGREKKISLCGIGENQTSANLAGERLGEHGQVKDIGAGRRRRRHVQRR